MKQIQNYQKRTSKHGFTLIELLVYLALVTVFLTVLTDIFASISSSRVESENTASVAQDEAYILTRLAYDARRADSITIPANPGDTNTTYTLNVGGNALTYALNGSDLLVTDSAGSYTLNGHNTTVSNFQVVRIGSGETTDTLRIDFTITSIGRDASGPESRTVQTTIGIR